MTRGAQHGATNTLVIDYFYLAAHAVLFSRVFLVPTEWKSTVLFVPTGVLKIDLVLERADTMIAAKTHVGCWMNEGGLALGSNVAVHGDAVMDLSVVSLGSIVFSVSTELLNLMVTHRKVRA